MFKIYEESMLWLIISTFMIKIQETLHDLGLHLRGGSFCQTEASTIWICA